MSHYDLSQNFNRLDLTSRPGDGGYLGHGSPYAPRQQSYPPPVAQQRIYAPPHDKPPLPSGWVPQYDAEYQRWYYYSKDTQRSQWEAPGSQGAGSDARGHGSGGGYASASHGYGGGGSHGYDGGHGSSGHGYDDKGKKDKDKKKGGMGGVLLAGAAGLGAGALIGHAIGDDSDSDHEHHGSHHAAYAVAPAAAYGGYGGAPVYMPPHEPGVPTYNHEGERLSESDKESVRSAREDYDEAYRKADDSDASSGDREELEEAREEYQEEYEEAYYDE